MIGQDDDHHGGGRPADHRRRLTIVRAITASVLAEGVRRLFDLPEV